jgi:hypothetical protein
MVGWSLYLLIPEKEGEVKNVVDRCDLVDNNGNINYCNAVLA